MNRLLGSIASLVVMAAGAVSAQTPAPGVHPVAVAPQAATRVVSGANGNVQTIIQGNALDSTNRVLPKSTVRLRDARTGRIIDTQLTDQSGLFTFRNIDPGSYIVELLSNDETILAASQLLNVNAGEAVSAIVKLPFRIPPFAGVLGHSTPSAIATAAAAVASGVLASQTTPAEASPRK